MQVGRHGGHKGSNDRENFGRVAKLWVDPETSEAYVADGYLNKRVAVLDADTGKMKRYSGAYGNKPADADLGRMQPAGGAGPAVPQSGALRRALERRARLGVRPPGQSRAGVSAHGKFVKEGFHATNTLGSGSTRDRAFSKDAQQN